jgi:hypothetical protein
MLSSARPVFWLESSVEYTLEITGDFLVTFFEKADTQYFQ